MVPTFPKYIFIDDGTIRRSTNNNVLRSTMDVGPEKTRPIQCKPMYNISFSISICDKDYLSFLEWMRTDIKYGSAWFLMKDPVDGVERRYRVLNPDMEFTKRKHLYLSQMELEAYDV